MLLKNAKIFLDETWVSRDLLIEDGLIGEIAEQIDGTGHEVIDLAGQVVSPGFIDVHVHWREPGFPHKETIAQASRAAARGGFTTAMPMPNLNPVPDSRDHLQEQLDLIKEHSVIRALPYGAITKEELGAELSEMTDLAEQVFAFSDDGRGVQDAATMYRAMELSAKLGKAIVAHCEDNSLILGGCMHDGKRSRELDLPGIPSVCESVQIARDILLAEATGCHYHVCHVSTKESVRLVREAKSNGIKVTCEVCPHHLVSDENDITHDTGFWKMNPPLRASSDREALIEGLLDGTIDLIATDHAPHAPEEKDCSMREAAFGIVGSETAFGLLYTHLVKPGILPLEKLLTLMSSAVADTFDLPYGRLSVGHSADLVVLELDTAYTINPDDFLSKGRNTPYGGQTVYGRPILTICQGEIVYKD